MVFGKRLLFLGMLLKREMENEKNKTMGMRGKLIMKNMFTGCLYTRKVSSDLKAILETNFANLRFLEL